MNKMRKFLCTISLAGGVALAVSVTSFAGTWGHDPSGWWYESDNGEILVDTWKNIGGEWYYFNDNSYMMTGWVKAGDKWYYCYLDGSLATDCWIDGKYYVGNDGAMLVNTTTSDGDQVDGQGQTDSYIDEFSADDVYVIGNPILTDCLFLKVNISDIKDIEDSLREQIGEEFIPGRYFICYMGHGISYVTHSTMDGDLYGIILTTDQFQLGCGLKVGMMEEDVTSLSLPFVSCSRDNYSMDSAFLEDINCPLNTLDYDTIYLYQFGSIPEDVKKENSIITGGRISITALVKDGVVISVFTNIPVAG